MFIGGLVSFALGACCCCIGCYYCQQLTIDKAYKYDADTGVRLGGHTITRERYDYTSEGEEINRKYCCWSWIAVLPCLAGIVGTILGAVSVFVYHM